MTRRNGARDRVGAEYRIDTTKRRDAGLGIGHGHADPSLGGENVAAKFTQVLGAGLHLGPFAGPARGHGLMARRSMIPQSSSPSPAYFFSSAWNVSTPSRR